jgi:hypothetical protein
MEFALKLNDYIEVPLHSEFLIQHAPIFKSFIIEPLVHRRFYFRGSRDDDPPAHFLIGIFEEQE